MEKRSKDKKILLLALLVLVIAYAATGTSMSKGEKHHKGVHIKQNVHVDMKVENGAINLHVACETAYKPFAKITGAVFGLDPCTPRYH